MRFAVAGELTGDATETLQSIERHAVETVERAQRINAIFRVTGVIDVVECFVPLPTLHPEHNAMDGSVHFRKSRRTAPVTGRPTDDRMNIHQRDQSARGPRIGERDVRAGGVLD